MGRAATCWYWGGATHGLGGSGSPHGAVAAASVMRCYALQWIEPNSIQPAQRVLHALSLLISFLSSLGDREIILRI